MAEIFTTIGSSLIAFGKSQQGKSLFSKVKLHTDVFWGKSLSELYATNTAFLSKTKTLIYRHHPIEIDKIYVETYLNDHEKNLISEQKIFELINENQNLIIKGIAGSGKSIFLKHLFLNFPIDTLNKTPFFIQLRELGELKIEDFLLQELNKRSKNFSNDHLSLLLKSGLSALFLDGFDEIEPDRRTEIEKNIFAIAKSFPEASIVITGRPDEGFDAWPTFSSYSMRELTKEQVLELADKIDVNREKIEVFKNEVQESLFETHSQFMENPLILSMLILVYCEGNSIPDETHLFYERAYEVLSLQHDGLKHLYERRFHSVLSPEQLRSTLELFCYQSFQNAKLSFDKRSIISIIKDSLEVLKLKADPQLVLKDFLESLSIIFLEGREYNFLHRSFQEYFAAYYLLHRIPDFALEGFSKLFTNPQSRNCIDMAFQMNNRFMNRFVLKAAFDKYFPELDNILEKDDLTVVKYIFYSFRVRENNGNGFIPRIIMAPKKEEEFKKFSLIVYALYTSPFERFLPHIQSEEEEDYSIGISMPDANRQRTNITQRAIEKNPQIISYSKEVVKSLLALKDTVNSKVKADSDLSERLFKT